MYMCVALLSIYVSVALCPRPNKRPLSLFLSLWCVCIPIYLRLSFSLCVADARVRARRIRYGGSRRASFHEGWVECRDKHEAKRMAAMLNGNRIGTKKKAGSCLYPCMHTHA
jgi:hypothetical protein